MNRLSLKLVAIACLISTAAVDSTQSRCVDSATKVVATYPNMFELSPFGCSKGRLVDDLVTGAGRFEIPSFDVKIQYADTQTDNPPTVQGLISNVQNGGSTKTLVAVSHMSGDGMGVAYYSTEAARNAAVSALVAAGWTEGPSGEILAIPGPPGPAIFLRGSGISGRIAPYLSTARMVLAIGCNSNGLQSSFGSFSDPGDYSGGTFVGVTATCPADEGCSIVNDIIAGTGCFRFPYEGHELDDAMRFKNWTGWVSVVGNIKNSLSCYKSCWNWSVTYRFVGVDNGSAVWGVVDEDALSYYELRGYANPGAPPEVLEAVPGFGTDGAGHLRVHATALPPGYAEYDVVEYDKDQFISVSPRFGPSDPVAPEFLAYTPGNDYDLDAITLEPEKLTLPVYGGKDLEALSTPTLIEGQDDLTGDAIVFAFHPGAVARVFQHLEAHYPTTYHNPPEIVWFYTFGVPTPEQITSAVNLVRANNQAAGGFPPNPDLQIVGDGGWATWPDDEDWSKISGSLRGYRPIYPQGSIGVIPSLDDTEIQRYLEAAEEYIDDQFVYDDAVFFVGDVLNDTTAAWLRDEVQHFAQAFPATVSLDFHYESDFASGDYVGPREASYAAINAGVGWVLTQGIRFDVDELTRFVRGSAGDPLQLTTQQRNIWLNFSCMATATWEPWTHQCKRILFNQIDRSIGVGFFGPMVDGSGIQHQQAREVFLAEMVKATNDGTPITLAQLGHRFQNALVIAIPEYDWYADCWAYLGSIAVPYRDGPVRTSVRGGEARSPRILIVGRNPSSDAFPLTVDLQRAGTIRIDVFDVAGRRVDTIVQGDFSAGEHAWTWNPSSQTASGVYFAVLSTKQERYSAKLIRVR